MKCPPPQQVFTPARRSEFRGDAYFARPAAQAGVL